MSVLARLETLDAYPSVLEPVKTPSVDFVPGQKEDLTHLMADFGEIRF